VGKIKGQGDYLSLLAGHYTISENDKDRRVSGCVVFQVYVVVYYKLS